MASAVPFVIEGMASNVASKSEASRAWSDSGSLGDLGHFPFRPLIRLQESGKEEKQKEEDTLCPLPGTYCLPGLGQKTAVLFLQALGQALQVLQLLIHGLGELQGLLGAEGAGHVATGARKTETTDGDPPRETEATEKNPRGWGDGDPERGGQRLREKRRGAKLNMGDRDQVST